MTNFDFSVHDADSGVTYRPWTDGHAVGYQVGWPDGSLTYIYLNASGGSDDGVANVFVYEGKEGDPGQDPPVHHYDLDWPDGGTIVAGPRRGQRVRVWYDEKGQVRRSEHVDGA